jgi:hypothetical protein
MWTRVPGWLISAVVVTGGCSGTTSSVVGGDSGTDASSGHHDGGGTTADSSAGADVGQHDARASMDSGLKLDAGAADSGVSLDARDSGLTADTGTVDSGVKPDSGSTGMDATPDARDSGSGCVIGGASYVSGAANPNDACESCEPGKSTSAWSSIADGTSCGNGQICASGMCGMQCDIDGVGIVASGGPNPANPCQSCQPGTSTSGWTSAQGVNANCPAGDVCNGNQASCASGCWIAGVFVNPGGTANGGCEVCTPGASTTAWTEVTGTASCPMGEVCSGGSCTSGCFIAGSFVSPGATANDGCEVCTPGASTTSWTDVTGAASCPMGQACDTGSCAAGCSIAGSFFGPGATANSGCEVCTPATSTTSWTDVFGPASCPMGQVCNAGSCTSCGIAATWSMTVSSITAVPPLCQGVMDCTGDCVDMNGTSTQPSATTIDWSIDPGGTICNMFTGTITPTGQFSSAETDCSPQGDGTTFDGQIDTDTCSMTGTYIYVLAGCTITFTISGTQ